MQNFFGGFAAFLRAAQYNQRSPALGSSLGFLGKAARAAAVLGDKVTDVELLHQCKVQFQRKGPLHGNDVAVRDARALACYKTDGDLKKLRGDTVYLNRVLDANIEGYRAIRNAGHAILPKGDADFEGEKYRKTCLRFFKLMCATSLGKLCASDHAMNAIDEMSALNRDLRKFFDANGAAYPVWQALEAEAGRYLQ